MREFSSIAISNDFEQLYLVIEMRVPNMPMKCPRKIHSYHRYKIGLFASATQRIQNSLKPSNLKFCGTIYGTYVKIYS